MVIKKTVAPPPKGGSSVHKPRIPQKKSQLTIDVSIKDTEVFKELLGVVHKIIMDDRMPDDLRDDAIHWCYGVGIDDREYAIFMENAVKPMATFDTCGFPNDNDTGDGQ